VRSQKDAVAEELSELKVQRRRDRIRMREMEERMARLAAERSAVERPELPVERLEPAPAEGEGEVEVVGVASDGTEIAYADDAILDESVAAPTDLLRASTEKPRARPRDTPRRGAPPPLEIPDDMIGDRAANQNRGAGLAATGVPTGGWGDTLGTTTGGVPTIGQVTRESPVPDRQAREPSLVTRRSRRPPVASTSATAVAEYQRLVALLRSGDHGKAIAGFRRFVARYPRSDYADNAQYWLGEAFYDQKQFERALREFERVAERFPGGNKVADAILKAAFCRINLKDERAAIALLSRLVADFPDSRPADLARQKLERLRR
jgi:tol-pal system protein YbgF